MLPRRIVGVWEGGIFLGCHAGAWSSVGLRAEAASDLVLVTGHRTPDTGHVCGVRLPSGSHPQYQQRCVPEHPVHGKRMVDLSRSSDCAPPLEGWRRHTSLRGCAGGAG